MIDKAIIVLGALISLLELIRYLLQLRGLRANGTKTYAKKLIHCLN
ncbi:hypothetical protein A1SK_04532 [Escherichia coli KTE56]|nr:hypothetical protein A1SK_04532 [Escherichia coli KTE56]